MGQLNQRLTLSVHATDERTSEWISTCKAENLLMGPIRFGEQTVRFEIPKNQFPRLVRHWKAFRRSHRKAIAGNISIRLHTKVAPLNVLLSRWKHAGLMLGIIGSVCLHWYCYQIIWDVQIRGGTVEKRAAANEALRLIGVKPYAWLRDVPDNEMIARQLMQRVPGLTWAGVEKTGTKLNVRLQEQIIPKKESPAEHGSDLKAIKDAVVSRLEVTSGFIQVQRFQHVKPGDVLVSGTGGPEAFPVHVQAVGHVYGTVWYEVTVRVPFRRMDQVLTGSHTDLIFLSIPELMFRVRASGDPRTTAHSDVVRSNFIPFSIGPLRLPLGIETEQHWQTSAVNERLSLEEAKSRAIGIARQKIIRSSGPDARKLAEKILHVQNDRDKVILKVLFEMEEVISREEPGTHG